MYLRVNYRISMTDVQLFIIAVHLVVLQNLTVVADMQYEFLGALRLLLYHFQRSAFDFLQ